MSLKNLNLVCQLSAKLIFVFFFIPSTCQCSWGVNYNHATVDCIVLNVSCSSHSSGHIASGRSGILSVKLMSIRV